MTNGNDTDIIKQEQSFESSKPQKKEYKLLSQEEYDALDNANKEKYIPYNPSLKDTAMNALIEQANAQMQVLSMYGPMFEKISCMPNPLPGEQLEQMVKAVEEMETLLDPIEALAGTPIIGALVSPLVNLIKSIFKVLGMIFWLIFAISRGCEIFADNIIQTYKQIDWEGLDNTVKDLKEKKKKTESVENNEINYDLLPTEEIKTGVKNVQTAVEACYDSINIVDSTSRVYKKVCEISLVPYSWEAFKSKCLPIFTKLGIDFSLLDKPTDSDKDNFEKLFPNPAILSKDLAGNVNKLVIKKQYISIDDNRELEEKRKEEEKRKAKEETKK